MAPDGSCYLPSDIRFTDTTTCPPNCGYEPPTQPPGGLVPISFPPRPPYFEGPAPPLLLPVRGNTPATDPTSVCDIFLVPQARTNHYTQYLGCVAAHIAIDYAEASPEAIVAVAGGGLPGQLLTALVMFSHALATNATCTEQT